MYVIIWATEFTENSIKLVRTSYYAPVAPEGGGISYEKFNSMIDFFVDLMKTYGCHSVTKSNYSWTPMIGYSVRSHSIYLQYEKNNVITIELCNSERKEKMNIPHIYSLIKKFRGTYINKIE